MNAAGFAMTGGLGGVPMRAGETALGSGPVRSSSTIQTNKAAGDAWEAEVINNVLPETQTNIRPQITVKSNGPSGLRVRLDPFGEDVQTGGTKLSDMKASPTAPLTPNQTIFYPELQQYGGLVVGQGKPPYTGGNAIPPTQVDALRKFEP